MNKGNAIAPLQTLAELEETIRRGTQTFIETGRALKEIRDSQRYRTEASSMTRKKYATFEEYCNQVWGFTGSRAHQQIEAAKVAANLRAQDTKKRTKSESSTKVEISDINIPINEVQARPLTVLPAEAQREVARTIDFTKATAEEIKERVQEFRMKIPPLPPDKKGKSRRDYITLKKWNEMSELDQKRLVFETVELGTDGFNSQHTNNIEWARWSWNPVTGCLHDCPYCYARDIGERIYEQGFVPSIIPRLLNAPENTRVPERAAEDIGYKNVFVCSMADLFGKWVPALWIEAVLRQVERNQQWNFLFLTKFPQRMAEFEYPGNAWLGTTVDMQARVKNAERAMSKVKASVRWLSLEPLLEDINIDCSLFQWVVIGGASKSSQTPEWRPPIHWICRITTEAHRTGCVVYHKTNLYGEDTRLREFPGAQQQIEPGAAPAEFQYLKVIS